VKNVDPLSQNPPCALSLSDLRLETRLGCGAEERARPQGVRFDLVIGFARPPEGSLTDRLDGTICYAELAELLRTLCQEREFHLIEHLGYEAYRRASRITGQQPLWLKVTKLRPPVPGLEGGASFELGTR
jgi:dihydroneopterin aldolase